MGENKLTDEQIMWEYMWECRSCAFWKKTDIIGVHKACSKKDGPFFNMEVFPSGTCDKWDPFDADLCFRVMEDSELINQASSGHRPKTPEQEAAIRRWRAV